MECALFALLLALPPVQREALDSGGGGSVSCVSAVQLSSWVRSCLDDAAGTAAAGAVASPTRRRGSLGLGWLPGVGGKTAMEEQYQTFLQESPRCAWAVSLVLPDLSAGTYTT